jgi:hypothetical protein
VSRNSQKKRALTKGPKKRSGGNHGNGRGTQFKPGQNSHTGEVFSRGPDQIPRGSVTLMLKTVLLDKRAAIYENLAELCETPAGALKFVELAADRIEGKPTQRHEHRAARQTIFQRDPDSGPPAALRVPSGTSVPEDSVLIGENGEAFVPFQADM